MAHAHLRTLPVRTGERFCADEVFGAASSRSCLFSVTDPVTRFCLAFEMATRKDGHNATALLEAARDRETVGASAGDTIDIAISARPDILAHSNGRQATVAASSSTVTAPPTAILRFPAQKPPWKINYDSDFMQPHC